MCIDPISASLTAAGVSASTAATVSLVTQGVGTAFSILGGLQQAGAQSAMYDYQAAVDRNNAEVARKQAEDARTRGQEEENRLRAKIRSTQADQTVAAAASGVDLGSDVLLDAQADAAYIGELDAMTIRENATNERWKYQVDEQNLLSSANANRASSKNAKTAGWIDAGSTILGGASTIGDRWAQYKKAGIF